MSINTVIMNRIQRQIMQKNFVVIIPIISKKLKEKLKMIIQRFSLVAIILSLSGCYGDDECRCASIAIQMSLVDEDGKAVFADSIKYTLKAVRQKPCLTTE